MSSDIQSRVRFIPQFVPQLKSQNNFLGGAVDVSFRAASLPQAKSKFLGDPNNNSFRLDYLA